MSGSAELRARTADHEHTIRTCARSRVPRRPTFLVRYRAVTSRQSEGAHAGRLALLVPAADALVGRLALLGLLVCGPRGERAVGRRPVQ